MRLTIVQSPLIWEDPDANRTHFAQLLQPLSGQTDLVVLPEMFSTGFSMQAEEKAELAEGPTLQWMQSQASLLNCAITGSIMCREDDRFYNRLYFVFPDGRLEQYDKGHLFSLAGEDHVYTPGTAPMEVSLNGWLIRPLVCYDLRFPEWSRNRPDQPYDLLIYVANWPSRRSHHWRALLKARAIENQVYCAGVNIAGTDGNGLEYVGDSSVFDFSGEELCRISGGQAGVLTLQLSRENLITYRKQFQFLADII